jgi:hypothetical protein
VSHCIAADGSSVGCRGRSAVHEIRQLSSPLQKSL